MIPPVKLATVSATGATLRYLATRCLIKTTFYSLDFMAGKPLKGTAQRSFLNLISE